MTQRVDGRVPSAPSVLFHTHVSCGVEVPLLFTVHAAPTTASLPGRPYKCTRTHRGACGNERGNQDIGTHRELFGTCPGNFGEINGTKIRTPEMLLFSAGNKCLRRLMSLLKVTSSYLHNKPVQEQV